MHNIAQPLVRLTAENTELISRFVQSPEMQAMVNDHARRYLDVAAQALGHAATPDAQADLVRRLSEHYAVFAQQFSKSLLGLV